MSIRAQTRFPVIMFLYSPEKSSQTCNTCRCSIYSQPGNNRVHTYSSQHKLSSCKAFFFIFHCDRQHVFALSCNEAARLQWTTWDMIRWHLHSKRASNLTTTEGKKPVIRTTDMYLKQAFCRNIKRAMVHTTRSAFRWGQGESRCAGSRDRLS